MARYKGAKWVGCSPANYSTDRIAPVRLVVHIAQSSTLSGIIAWFENPDHGSQGPTSAHFGNPRWLFGRMVQFVDTDEMAYHCAQWNGTSIGVENVGYSGQRLSLGQRIRMKRLIKWANEVHAIPVVYTGDPSVHGVIGHGKLPEGYLSHPYCPGEPVLADINTIVHQINRKVA